MARYVAIAVSLAPLPFWLGCATPREALENEKLTIENIRVVAKAEAHYLKEHGRFGDVKDLVDRGFLRGDVADPVPNGYYRFEVKAGGNPKTFTASAVPDKYGKTGRYSFFM
jgi:hypothetical protein